MISFSFSAWWVVAAAHVICGWAAVHGFIIDWRAYREARVRYVVDVLARRIDPHEDHWAKPHKPRAWAVLLLPPVTLDLMLIWGWLHAVLRHG